MSFRSQAMADCRSILNDTGEPVKLTDPGSTEYNIIGSVNRIEAVVDPQTNQLIADAKTSVTIALGDLPSEPTEEWEVEITDGVGNLVSGLVSSPEFDRTLGYVIFNIEVTA